MKGTFESVGGAMCVGRTGGWEGEAGGWVDGAAECRSDSRYAILEFWQLSLKIIMASPRRRLPAGSGSTVDCRQTLAKIRRSVPRGTVDKLFEDDHFVFELIEVLNDDTVDITVKTEFLSILEQHGCDHINASSVGQVLSVLLDVLRDNRGHADALRFLVQLLLSITTLIIQNDLLQSEHCASFLTMLWEIVGRVNDVGTRRLRSCGCQCLRQLEMWSPRLLSRHKDRIMQIVREERTGVFQDYAALLSTVLSNLTHQTISRGTSHKSNIPAEEVVPPLSYLMDNAFLFTPAGLWSVVLSMLHMVKTTDHVAPSIFKPLMLQNMATFDPCLLHIILYVQRELQGEILTKEEEMKLLQRLTSGINILSLHPALRLLLLQWLKGYTQVADADVDKQTSHSQLARVIQHHLHPSVFDSLDIHVDKLNILTCSHTGQEDQKLVDSVYYLQRLALTTGNEQATAGLYRVLFAAYTHHHTQHLADAVLRSVYTATLSSLHDQVLNGGQAEVLAQFRFYLQVLSVSAKQPDIPQNKTVRFLLSLVRYAEQRGACDWALGSAVLSICRNLLLHHSSDHLHYDLGELLFQMLMCFTDTAVRSRARLLYALLSGSSDEKESSAPYEMISAVSVSVKPQTESDAFSKVKGSKNVCIRLSPKVPQPTVFTVGVMFCAEDHTTVSCPLQPLEVTFSDLTMPLPWQHLQLQDFKDRQLIFGDLWESFTDTRSSNSGHGVESVKVLKCSADKLRQVWAPFRLQSSEDDKAGSDKYLIFLPPTHHLLFQVYTQGQNQVISMATDYWKLLPSINNYLNSLSVAT
ncbi:hypothetical protein BaRGS_00011848 [Batillaria attramentaria]|uniref:Adaptor-related protein complex 5 beta subunit n=1 Tax=Batillaria attramentaria TaxID=370345 RepID=A0ABD0LBU2_9CAEN